ncbi:uncharacterized protein F5Z01DRAFT_281551 [Emericellopsis atlantica]|uniref:Uncharacterized protein n=1 Tax=Emericellopsis atlantica TaxID=2614577 RepID=A0A9P7ZGW2_9HYPO|nr:uncharacterized protein F5Z01DRAFT_281551 [Emericellopsis atlantica]KAG9251447.1 hypothetical protein F5Z01DRAFT_281551 [Emericellopsis atlantica]
MTILAQLWLATGSSGSMPGKLRSVQAPQNSLLACSPASWLVLPALLLYLPRREEQGPSLPLDAALDRDDVNVAALGCVP